MTRPKAHTLAEIPSHQSSTYQQRAEQRCFTKMRSIAPLLTDFVRRKTSPSSPSMDSAPNLVSQCPSIPCRRCEAHRNAIYETIRLVDFIYDFLYDCSKHIVNFAGRLIFHLWQVKPCSHEGNGREARTYKTGLTAQGTLIRVEDVRQDEVENDAGESGNEPAQTLGLGPKPQRRCFSTDSVGCWPCTNTAGRDYRD
ncbi:hypothetical protein RIB2604_01704250 [Aspergillus luchuensis]|uniref:Uncharacterized protein n=1 Tax=Aspergillus kawachii TaxID=1069201 RepID=A0A146FBL7_ASPKA|nr:hypothetical protein RIB2604_01704250 [Aspergillus luchuensis]